LLLGTLLLAGGMPASLSTLFAPSFACVSTGQIKLTF
jgi:hypothetical protein